MSDLTEVLRDLLERVDWKGDDGAKALATGRLDTIEEEDSRPARRTRTSE